MADVIKTVHGGHGGKNDFDPGAVSAYGREVDMAREISQLILNRTGAVNTSDGLGTTVNQNLANITQNINRVANDSDWNLSIHMNSATPSATGVEVFAFGGDPAGMAKASQISKAISKVLGIPDRGAKDGSGLYVIRNTKGHTLLIEVGFVSNANDVAQIRAKKEQVADAIVSCFGYKTEAKPAPKDDKGVIKVINLWDYTGKLWLPDVQRDYATLVSNDRVFGVKTGSNWRARMIHVTYEQAVAICKQLRLQYPKYVINGFRINANDPITPKTPFAVEVDGVDQKDINDVIRFINSTFAGITTGDRIFLTPQNDKQVILEIHNIPKGSVEGVKAQLKAKYKINDSQFK